MKTMSIEERKMLAVPIEMLEDVPLDESNPEKFTKIGTSMQEKTKQEIIGFLRQSTDVFTWSHEDIPGIDQPCDYSSSKCALSYKLVHQKKRVFALEQDNAIKEEVHKLVTIEFICEVY